MKFLSVVQNHSVEDLGPREAAAVQLPSAHRQGPAPRFTAEAGGGGQKGGKVLLWKGTEKRHQRRPGAVYVGERTLGRLCGVTYSVTARWLPRSLTNQQKT